MDLLEEICANPIIRVPLSRWDVSWCKQAPLPLVLQVGEKGPRACGENDVTDVILMHHDKKKPQKMQLHLVASRTKLNLRASCAV